MLKLTKKADYGLIALKHLAVNQTRGSSSAKEIADCYGIPLPLLSKILQKLGKSGFLQSEQGTNGGYKLARDPREITALEVIRTIDSPIVLTAPMRIAAILREPLHKQLRGGFRGCVRHVGSDRLFGVSLWRTLSSVPTLGLQLCDK